LFVESLEERHLEQLVARAPAVDALVGIGGGGATDAAKHLAAKTGLPFVLIPTTVSSNSAVSPLVGVQRDGVRDIAWGVPRAESILYDVHVVRSAATRINRSGIAEVLCHYPGLYDWRLASDRRLGMSWDDALAREVEDMENQITTRAEDVRRVTDLAIETLVTSWVRMGELFELHRADNFGSGADHVFVFNFGKVTGKRLAHTQLVGLGVLLMAAAQDHRVETIANALVASDAPFHPVEIGTNWDEVRHALGRGS
jgi:glycerol dehydrogenase-like iron-containing ADH family enzyme